MAIHTQIELRPLRNGVVAVNYWDNLHGHDVIMEIQPDGTVYKYDYSGTVDTRQVVNLMDELRKIAQTP